MHHKNYPTKKNRWCTSNLVISLLISFVLAYMIIWLKMSSQMRRNPILRFTENNSPPREQHDDGLVNDITLNPKQGIDAKQKKLLVALGAMDVELKHSHQLTLNPKINIKHNNLLSAPITNVEPEGVSEAPVVSKNMGHPTPSEMVLVSAGAYVTASIRGHKGSPSNIVDPNKQDKQNTMWQAGDTKGKPMRGPQFIRLGLKEPAYQVTKIVIDFDEGNSDQYIIEAFCVETGVWSDLHNNMGSDAHANTVDVMRRSRHVINTITILNGYASMDPSKSASPSNMCMIAAIRISFKKPATKRAIGIWQVQVWGYLPKERP
jgi:hypothetical protein